MARDEALVLQLLQRLPHGQHTDRCRGCRRGQGNGAAAAGAAAGGGGAPGRFAYCLIVNVDLLALTAEERFDSLIFVGRPGDKATLFTQRTFQAGGGHFTVTAQKELFVILRDLRSATPDHQPLHVPDDTFVRNSAPDGRLSPRVRDPVDPLHTVTTFAHELSSLKVTLVP